MSMPQPAYTDHSVTLYLADCLDVLSKLPDATVDAVVTDPPYGLEFMGREWDGADGFRRSLNRADVSRDSVFGRTSRSSPEYRAGVLFQQWCEAWAAECLRVLKPGGHLLAFGGTRTYHRLVCAIEDAGFEVRDTIAWLYGSGFPKSLDVSKAIDRAAGAEREVIGPRVRVDGKAPGRDGGMRLGRPDELGALPSSVTAPATDDARRWSGWGTALKPAHEPIVVARKPLAGTVAANVLAHGTGALNIDRSRVEHDPAVNLDAVQRQQHRHDGDQNWRLRPGHEQPMYSAAGRWPTNVVLDEAAASVLDEQSGTLTSGANPTRRGSDKFRDAYGEFAGQTDCTPARGADSGGASRFFPVFRYEAKADGNERPRVDGIAHPTVKPLDLMRWLVRLVTPPGGLVLDPFAGSGTTAEACVIEGLRCVAIEREPTYLPLITARLTKPLQPLLDLGGVA